MSKLKPQNGLENRFPNLGNLTVNIIQHIVEPVLGKDAIEEIAKPYKNHELYLRLCEALEKAEKRFIQKYPNSDVAKGLIQLSLFNLDSARSHFWGFSKNPADSAFQEYLSQQFHKDFPKLEEEKRQEAITGYISILKAEMISIDEEIRQRVSTTALLSVENDVKQISSTLNSIDKNTRDIADALLKGLPRPIVDEVGSTVVQANDVSTKPEPKRSVGDIPIHFRKYLENLRTNLLEVFRQDQHVLLSVGELSNEDPDTLLTLQQTLRSAYSIHIKGYEAEALPQAIEECLNDHRLTVLLGDPGAGKTTSLRYLALRQIEKFLNCESNLLPVWASLSHWQDKETVAKDFLWQEFADLCTENNAPSRDEFERLLNDGYLLIFLDGLNELPHREQESQDLPANLRDKKASENKIIDPREGSILSLSKDANSQLALSCRISEYIHLPGWREFRILPLSDQQISELVKKHLGSKSPILDEILARQPDLRNLVRNAFFLRSLIRLVQEGWEKIPSNRFELVQFTCRAALNRESVKQGKDTDEIIDLIGKFSYEAMDDGLIGSTIGIPVKSITLGENNTYTSSGENQLLSAFIFAEAAGLVMNIKNDGDKVVYRYLHQLVQEALALIYLNNQASNETEYPQVFSLIQIGRIHHYWGKTKEAQENFIEALNLCPSIGLDKYRAVILLNLSMIYRSWQLSTKSIEYAEMALQILGDLDETPMLASVYHELGIVYERLWRNKDAEKHYLRAVHIYQKIVDRQNYAYEIVYGIGDFYGNPKTYQFRKAINWYKKALETFQEIGDKHGVGITHYYIGSGLRLIGDVEGSEEYFKTSIEELEKLNDKRMIMNASQYLGYLYRDTRQYSKAQPCFEKAYQITLETGDLYQQLTLLVFGFAWIASYQNKHNLALDYVDKALNLAKRISEPEAFEMVYGAGYGFVCWRGRKYEDAYLYLQEYKKYIGGEIDISIIDFLLIKWSDILGKSIGASPVKRFITDIFFYIQLLYVQLNNPATRFGKLMWMFSWRFMYLKNWGKILLPKG